MPCRLAYTAVQIALHGILNNNDMSTVTVLLPVNPYVCCTREGGRDLSKRNTSPPLQEMQHGMMNKCDAFLHGRPLCSTEN